jgi:hypothetical protein
VPTGHSRSEVGEGMLTSKSGLGYPPCFPDRHGQGLAQTSVVSDCSATGFSRVRASRHRLSQGSEGARWAQQPDPPALCPRVPRG